MHDNPYQAPAPIEAVLADGAQESPETLRRAVTAFRGLLGLYAMLLVLTTAANLFLESFLPDELQAYLELEIEAEIDGRQLAGISLALPSLGCLLVGWLGMFFFWRPSRWLFLASQVLFFGAIGAMGPYVSHGFDDALDFASQLVAGAILAIAFASPVQRLFRKRSTRGGVGSGEA